MTDALKTSVLALDGGGTRCRLALSGVAGVTAVETGSANISTDLDGAVQQVTDGLARLSEVTGHAVEGLVTCPIYIGIAGVTGPVIADRFAAALPFHRARVTDDRPTALNGALGGSDGLIAHCGTGSFFAAQLEGQSRFAGGWGAILGDPASAQWVGRRALSCTLEEVDLLREASGLGAHLLNRFGGSAEIVAFAASATPADFGRVAPDVTEFAATGDPLAVDILNAAGRELSSTLHKMGWVAGLPLCLTGGIAPQFLPYLPPAMQEACISPKGTPLDGAIILAHEFAQEVRDDDH
ncbi:BadF/BadG/BcrA/BcrD ATPase family protein [Tritonibacter scottomollicae]|uniref:Glucosamine kinase n=1 Tax=Tritonibacter scottomollicae TaxID=483013 RepID=A0A2T1AAW1_TRISK|nr:BadF/BadG/BcrA/BcrD ATPase family protein [Tritonibacter scottomollicae]PRZ45726.1 glucosamine kinase [Tritonibacter scottomollicae]